MTGRRKRERVRTPRLPSECAFYRYFVSLKTRIFDSAPRSRTNLTTPRGGKLRLRPNQTITRTFRFFLVSYLLSSLFSSSLLRFYQQRSHIQRAFVFLNRSIRKRYRNFKFVILRSVDVQDELVLREYCTGLFIDR